ncbi:MAG: nucleoside phosphorylase [Treponema sp.]|nr:nucleoside phosphorylase [Treponema sp.]
MDIEKYGVRTPYHSVKVVEGFPSTVIITFSLSIIKHITANYNTEIIAELRSANGIIPIYKVVVNGKEMAVYMSPMGASICIARLEEVIVMGAKNIVIFGSCGALNDRMSSFDIVVPTVAISDEGTSKCYSGNNVIKIANANIVESKLAQLGVNVIKGACWTTDGLYRETVNKIRDMKNRGAIVVDMEMSAIATVCEFRNVQLYAFLYCGDLIIDNKWNEGLLKKMTKKEKITMLEYALNIGIGL